MIEMKEGRLKFAGPIRKCENQGDLNQNLRVVIREYQLYWSTKLLNLDPDCSLLPLCAFCLLPWHFHHSVDVAYMVTLESNLYK